MKRLLEVNDLYVNYGTIKALDDVSFFVDQGEIVALLGPNGAGKSTALKAICGLVPVRKGRIEFQYRNIRGLTPDRMVKKGMSLVPEGRRVFSSMTVVENLEMGAFTVKKKDETLIKERMSKVYKLFPILKERKKQKAGTLSSGEQQMLAIGRALMLKPSLLLLDEPSLGLSPNYVDRIFETLIKINKNGTSLLIVEQNVTKAIEVCHRGYVLQTGSVAFEGDKEKLLKYESIKI